MTLAPAALSRMQSAVLDWYAANGRDLAFRQTADPWAILVSEVMAQQTQAARAAGHWTRFMAQFPTPTALAAASPATVIRAWRGLGYNRRAIALRAAAIRIEEDHGGVVPSSLEELQALPGIGPYTARAVLAIAFDRPVAALDTNIRRVLDRAFGPLPSSTRSLQATADGLVPANRAAAWTHALMDIGAAFCRLRQPHCDGCPLVTSCRFRAAGPAASRPRTRRPHGPPAAPRFEATSRWLRGRILDRLRDTPDGEWLSFDQPIGDHSIESVRLQIGRLASDGLVDVETGTTKSRLVTSS